MIQKNSSGDRLNLYSYQHDLNRNIIKLTENNQSYGFTYDTLDRISTSDIFNEAYQYDKRGNRSTLASSQLPLTSDADLEYDERNHIKKVTKDGKEVSYKYNGDGLLYERTENCITSRFYYDGNNLIAEGTVQADSSSVKKAEYLYGNQLVSKDSNTGAKAYYTFNGHGDVKELRDATGGLLNQYSYDIWGNSQAIIETDKENPFLYSGEYWDKATSLQYLRARWYDPSLGRFISEDTYAGDYKNPLSLNLYSYVENNPLKYWDPSGHTPQLEMGEGGGKVSNKEKAVIAEWADQAAYNSMMMLYGTLYTSLEIQRYQAAMDASSGSGGGMYFKGTGNLAFSGGKAGEKYLANLVGGKPQVYFKTSSGGRYIDQLANGIAYESKVGYTSLTSRIKTQILKDAELIKKGQINGAEWNFFRSADTGKIGASKQLIQFLKQNGIKYKIHY
jgi:RHS repeat-associated protein